MKKPAQPPDFRDLIASDSNLLERIYSLIQSAGRGSHYYHWDKLRHLTSPEGFTSKEWWAATKIGRLSLRQSVELRDQQGREFAFCVPERVLQLLHQIDLGAGGKGHLPREVANAQTRDQYLVSSLMQEAITSSQLEGAATTREVAKEMLRSGRAPRDTSERMILNNYLTMQDIREAQNQPLSEALVFAIHAKVTRDTLERPDAAGRYRQAAENINVADHTGEVFHIPPKAEELPARLQAMCDFANGAAPSFFVHPVLRAIILHFWLAYDHPFVDGNGRTARALFYWSMLRQGYQLFEFISISNILRQSPARYARSFLYTETDDNDLTYFIIHQLEVIGQAIDALHHYIEQKTAEVKEVESRMRAWDHLNHRQIALLSHAMRHPGFGYTVEGHQTSHNTVYETARKDLLSLAEDGLLEKSKRGRMMVFRTPKNLQSRIERHDAEVRILREI